MTSLTCHGAAGEVTGSCHLLECAGQRILVDCGLFQGRAALERENALAFAFDPASIDFVLLTHAHLDHCGRLPLLARRGFRGEIIATAPTRELTRLVLTDAASLQEEEAKSHARKLHGPAPPPLYTLEDAFHAMDFFGRRAEYGRDIELAPGLRCASSTPGTCSARRRSSSMRARARRGGASFSRAISATPAGRCCATPSRRRPPTSSSWKRPTAIATTAR